jgi:hypothetical protein
MCAKWPGAYPRAVEHLVDVGNIGQLVQHSLSARKSIVKRHFPFVFLILRGKAGAWHSSLQPVRMRSAIISSIAFTTRGLGPRGCLFLASAYHF